MMERLDSSGSHPVTVLPVSSSTTTTAAAAAWAPRTLRAAIVPKTPPGFASRAQ
ncbi:hypothetical protein ACFYUK_45455 [Nonomuraea wenchangensis]